jgi:hypothetical protein
MSTFVHGTTNPQVFAVNGTRRAVPDDATLKLLSVGQTVRTITDAELAAIALGPSLPSRADGTLLSEQQTPPPPTKTVFFMARGLRRRVPDRETLSGLVTRGSAVHDIARADLLAIPEGPPLPTRAEGTLYRGTGAVYAYLIRSGQKLAVPNATTMRDAGFDPVSRIAIAAEDLADTPQGAPFASSSRFLSPPSSSIPLVLLPVRLETRFQGSELWLRVYPDDVHINSFEPELTTDESSARAQYLNQAHAGQDTARAAFLALAQRYGAERAAWIASAHAQPGTNA